MTKISYKIYLVIKNLICCCLFIGIILATLAFLAPVFRNEEEQPNESVLATFYEQDKDSADVVFIGSSALYRFIAPTQMYDKYGITCLNYASAAMDVNAMAGLIDEVIDYQHPEVVVLEMRNYVNNCENRVQGIEYTEKELLAKESFFRKLINNMPVSFNRAKVIHDTVTGSLEQDDFDWQFEYMSTHFNWKNLKLRDIIEYMKARRESELIVREDPESTYKGADYKGTIGVKSIQPNQAVDFTNYEERSEITGEWRDVLMKIIKKAKKCGTEVLFFTSPYPIDATKASYENSMGDILEQEGMNFLNCNKLIDEIGIDFSYDFYDDKHTNVNGMVKVTNYVGQYLIDKYDLKKSELTDEQKKDWDTATDKWIKEIREPGIQKVKDYIEKQKATTAAN